MLARKHFDVMVVDDEPDVLQITTLALKGLQYNGGVLRLHPFSSKRAALEFMQNLPDPTSIAVALVDVIMETDTAGLEFCDYLRNAMKNDVTQLIIRTGQPGRSPERVILESFDVNGYIAKAEATQETLYCMMLSALRQYDWAVTALMQYRFFNTLLPAFRSPDEVERSVRKFITHLSSRNDSVACNLCLFIDERQYPFGIFTDPQVLTAAETALRGVRGRQLSEMGDKYSIVEADGALDVLIALARDANDVMPRVELVSRIPAKPTEFAITTWHRMLLAIRRFLMLAEFVHGLRQDPTGRGQ
jgi:CheY-like chemotaxis protein